MSLPPPDPQRNTLQLAAALHNVGVFYRLATDNGTTGVSLSEEILSQQSRYCPTSAGSHKPQHQYVLWSGHFLLEQQAHWERLFPGYQPDADDSLLATVVQQQQPTAVLDRILHQCHYLAAGVTPSSAKLAADIEQATAWKQYAQRGLRPVLSSLMQPETNSDYRMPLTPVDLSRDFFPRSGNVAEDQTNQANQLWQKFGEELANNQAGEVNTFVENYFGLLHKYATNIPQYPHYLPDVSVYDHARLTTALAVSMFDYLQEQDRLTETEVEDNEEPWLMVGGDLSGIQKFIYDVISSDAAKNLKGRSFYLHLTAESIVDEILKRCHLSSAHIIYASGGGFYLLVPNTWEVKHNLQVLENDLTKKLYAAHGTLLYLAIDYQPVSSKALVDQNLGTLWQELTERLARKKRQRYKTFLPQTGGDLGYQSLFESEAVTGDEERDRITNEIIPPSKHPYYLDGDKSKPLKYSTYQQILLGRQLKATNTIYQSSNYVATRDGEHINPLELGNNYYLFTQDTLLLKNKSFATTVLNNTDFLPPNAQQMHRFNFYGGNDFPTTIDAETGKERIKMFERVGL